VKRSTKVLIKAVAIGGFIMANAAMADTTVSTFDDFSLDGLFGSWGTANILSLPTGYQITSTGFGSGFKNISPNLNASGETKIELTITLSGSGSLNSPISGPIVSLVDSDGTFVNYAWYGQTAGRKVLIANLDAPTSISNGGTVSGLDLGNLDFFHLQDDPGSYNGQYTITFEHLRLTGAPRPVVTANFYNESTREFTLTWSSLPGRAYAVLYAAEVAGSYNTLLADIPSGGVSTTATVMLPTGEQGFLRVLQQ